MAVLKLVEDHNLKQNEVASLLNLSPATVSRRLKEAREERRAQHRDLTWMIVRIVWTLCFMISTAALATMAWG